MQVNTNGFVSVDNPPDQSQYLGKMPATFGFIAAFLGDLDTSDGAGKVYYRQDTSPELLQRIVEQIGQAFPDESKLELNNALVVTWENVAAHGAQERGDGSPEKASPFEINQGCFDTFNIDFLLLSARRTHLATCLYSCYAIHFIYISFLYF